MLKYQVSFKVLNTLNKDEQPKLIVKYFENENPLIARQKAMQLVSDYIEILKENNRLDESNGTVLKAPSFLGEKLNGEEIDPDHHWGERLQVKIILSKDLARKHNLMRSPTKEIKYKDIHIPAEPSRPMDLVIVDIHNNIMDECQLSDNLEIEADIFIEEGIIKENDLNEYIIYGDDYMEGVEDGELHHILPVPIRFPKKAPEKYEFESSEDTELEIEEGEGNLLEFKPALIYNFKTGKSGIGPKYHAAKTICSFLNSNGGTLCIGVSDDGIPKGLEYDFSILGENAKDKLKLELDQLISHFFNTATNQYITSEFVHINEIEIFIIRVKSSNNPVFLKRDDGEKEFLIRTQASSKKIIDMEEVIQYVLSKNWNKNEEGIH